MEIRSSTIVTATTMSSNTATEHFFNRSYFGLASQSNSNFTNTNDSFNVTDVVVLAPATYYFIGSLMTIIMVTGFSTNLAILYTYATNRKIRTVDNTLIIGLALSDIGQSIFGIPFVAISSFSKQWIFGPVFCQYYAFITTSFGIAQICMLTVIAMERYFVIVRHDRRLTNTPCRCVIIILFSFVYGSSWATGPLLGWSGYKEEEIGIACCVKWEIKDSVAFSYTISLCTFGWFIPLFLIAFGYISITCSIYHERSKRLYLRRQTLPNKINRERKVAFTVLIMIGAFIVSWTPYSAVSLWSAVGEFHRIPLWVQVTPAVFAKCSIIWNPLIYVARHENFRQGVKQSLAYFKFWSRDLNQTNVGGINTFQQSARRRQIYKDIDRNDTKNPLKHSITSDNYVTYMESPVRSKSLSSVFLRSPVSLKRHRLRRRLTFISTLDSSPQIIENSETDAFDFPKRVEPGESKYTQTDYVFVYTPSTFTDKCIQTDFSSPVLNSSLIVVSEHDTNECAEKRNEHIEKDNEFAVNLTANEERNNAFNCQSSEGGKNIQLRVSLKSNKEIRNNSDDVKINLNEQIGNVPLAVIPNGNEENIDDEMNSLLPLDNENPLPFRTPKLQKTKSLQVLKKKRTVLKHQLEIMYQENLPSEVLPICNERQELNKFRSLPTSIIKPGIMTEDRKQKRMYKFKPIRVGTDIPYESDFDMTMQGRSNTSKTSLPKRLATYNRYLQPYYVQRREKYRERMIRERIVSEPAGVEMQTYYHKTFANKVKTYQEIENDNDTVIKIYPSKVRETVIRQSTV